MARNQVVVLLDVDNTLLDTLTLCAILSFTGDDCLSAAGSLRARS